MNKKGLLNKINKPLIIPKSRVDWIRTSDPLHPMQIRYRTAPPPETFLFALKRAANVKGF